MTTITPPPPVVSGAGLVRRMVGNEVRKGLLLTWRSPGDRYTPARFRHRLYWMIQFYVGGGRIITELAAQTLVGYLAFVVAYTGLVRMVGGLLEEMFTGTLMQSLLSPLRPWVLTSSRLIAILAEGVLAALVVALIFMPLLGIDIPFRWEVLIPPFSFCSSRGVRLVRRRPRPCHQRGRRDHPCALDRDGYDQRVFRAHHRFPGLAGDHGQGVADDVVRGRREQILFHGANLSDLWSNITLPLAIGHAVLMVLLGWTVFQLAIRRGLKLGRLGP